MDVLDQPVWRRAGVAEVNVRREEAQKLERRAQQIRAHGSHFGVCGATAPDTGQCSAASSGSFSTLLGGIADYEQCMERCRACSNCRYVSVSFDPPNWDCSWYSQCRLDDLHHPRALDDSSPEPGRLERVLLLPRGAATTFRTFARWHESNTTDRRSNS